MKLYAPDKSMLMDISAIKVHPDGLLIEGKIMGAMPMKAVLRPEELRSAFKLADRKVAKRLMLMMFGRPRRASGK